MMRKIPKMANSSLNTFPLASILEKKMATHSSVLTWEIAQIEEPDGLQSMGSQRVGCDRVTFPSLHLTSI